VGHKNLLKKVKNRSDSANWKRGESSPSVKLGVDLVRSGVWRNPVSGETLGKSKHRVVNWVPEKKRAR